MNDSAIEKRTKLRLEDEAERQLQLLEDLKLEKRFERSQKGTKKNLIIFIISYILFFFIKERKMELEQMLHKLDMVQQQHASRLKEKDAENQLERQHQQSLHEDEIQFYQSLKQLGTDITQIMVAKERNPDKLIQIVNDNDKTEKRTPPNLQFVDHI
jgi:hypothetical protein